MTIPFIDFRRISESTVELFFPRRCAGCGLRGVWVCRTCIGETPLFCDPKCDQCGLSRRNLYCSCEVLPAQIDQSRFAGPLQGWLRSAVHSFKYEGETARAKQLSELLLPLLEALPGDALLVPVPLHPKRLNERGYNQSAILCRELRTLSGRASWSGLTRIKDTPHQVGLSARERTINVQRAFSVSSRLVPPKLILVDDVVTTGATVSECARALRVAGAQYVAVVTIAHDS